jgi:hypothetical protein
VIFLNEYDQAAQSPGGNRRRTTTLNGRVQSSDTSSSLESRRSYRDVPGTDEAISMQHPRNPWECEGEGWGGRDWRWRLEPWQAEMKGRIEEARPVALWERTEIGQFAINGHPFYRKQGFSSSHRCTLVCKWVSLCKQPALARLFCPLLSTN